MQRIPAIKSVMTPFPYSIEIDASLGQAEEMMTRHQIHHLPVIEEGRLVGVITERDLRLALDPQRRSSGVFPSVVRDARPREAYIVELDERLDNVLCHMAATHIDAAIVVKDGKLAGIFTMTDACRAFAELLRAELFIGGDDDVA